MSGVDFAHSVVNCTRCIPSGSWDYPGIHINDTNSDSEIRSCERLRVRRGTSYVAMIMKHESEHY